MLKSSGFNLGTGQWNVPVDTAGVMVTILCRTVLPDTTDVWHLGSPPSKCLGFSSEPQCL